MLLDYYRKVEYPTTRQEIMLYSMYRSRVFRGVTGTAAADCLSGYALDVKLIHSSEELLDNRDGYFQAELYGALLAEYRERMEGCRDRVSVVTGVDFQCDDLKRELDAGKQIMLECIIPGNADGLHDEVLHWILIYGYEGEVFLACDPLSAKIRLKSEKLENYMDTSIGKICIVVGERLEREEGKQHDQYTG